MKINVSNESLLKSRSFALFDKKTEIYMLYEELADEQEFECLCVANRL